MKQNAHFTVSGRKIKGDLRVVINFVSGSTLLLQAVSAAVKNQILW
jgi:hypothetical protein